MNHRQHLMAVAAAMGIMLPDQIDMHMTRAVYPRSPEHAAELVRKLRAFQKQRPWHRRARRRKIDLPAHQRYIYRRAA